MKEELLFYNAYESFYDMANESKCFKKYCTAAYGANFSQDGFSDINQINLIFDYAPKTDDLHILDIGCGNGKMLKYLQSRIGGYIYGFDFSEIAIRTARSENISKSEFKEGIIGEIDYLPDMFNLIISMDTVYFAKDMTNFLGQVYIWLKNDGIFFIGYQEGDIMPKTDNCDTTVLVKALNANNFKYDVIDYTRQTYDMLNHKRKTIIDFHDDFIDENLQDWYSIILNQTNSAAVSYEEYKAHNARNIFVAGK